MNSVSGIILLVVVEAFTTIYLLVLITDVLDVVKKLENKKTENKEQASSEHYT